MSLYSHTVIFRAWTCDRPDPRKGQKKVAPKPLNFFEYVTKGLRYHLKSQKIHPVLSYNYEFTSSRNPHNLNFAKIGLNKLFKASYFRYLVGRDTHILFFLLIFYLEKSLGFVF